MNLSANFKADKRTKTKQRREEYTMRRSVAATSAIQKCTTTKINEPSKQQAENKKKINMTAILATTNNLDIMTIMDHIFSANKNKQTTTKEQTTNKKQTTKSSRLERVLVIR